jgi:cellulose synthase/poly-beta-1,6-N-acetylglucosamine synthase-like glycosyltransferase
MELSFVNGAAQFLFWMCVFLVAYPYLIYPLLVKVIARLRPRPVRKAAWEPKVTVLIPAYNEASCIRATVQNKLDQSYPQNRLQIIVVSDGSDDGTDEIVREFSPQGVRLLRREGREGKAAALNEAIRHAEGEIVVFSDANSLFDTDTIRSLVENFADPEVGYVTGSLRFSTDGTSLSGDGGGAYIRYENALRSAETRLGSIIGVNGGVDAIRRVLYVDIPRQLITDFVLPLSVIAAGHRVVFDSGATSVEEANSETNSEFRMRVRVALRALQGLVYMKRLLNPFAYPLVSFCLISHKLLRYIAFLFLLVALACNFVLAMSSPFYQLLLSLHIAGYLLALVGLSRGIPPWLRRLTLVPSYLLMTYAAFAMATFKFFRGDSMAVWRPRAG